MNKGMPSLLSVSNNIDAGMELAKQEFTNVSKNIINKVAVPAISVVLIGLLLFFIAGAVARHRQGSSYGDKLIPIGICVVVLALVVTFPVWGWTMIGI